jgi:CelD/BcsL family acetyltransferase involved in cellulose biosynthesis
MNWTNLPARQLLDTPALQQQWDRLNAARHDLPFLSAQAIGAALQVFGQGHERLLLAKDSTGEPVAMLLLVPDGRLRWATFQPSQVPLGAWVAQAGRSTTTLCRSLLRGPLGFALVVSLTQTDPLLAAREADAADTRHADYIPTAWIDVDGSFDDYWAARGKNLRQNLRKQRNKLATEGRTTTMQVWQAPQDMAGAIARYGALEAAGWKAGRGTAIHHGNDQGRYYTQLLEDAARLGQARVYEYLLDGQTVAMNLCLLRGGTLVVLKTTYDESLPKSLSPAFLLREEELQHFFAGGEVKRIEYYGRVMEWHTKLTEQQRTLYHLTAYRWPLLKRLAERRTQQQQLAPKAAVPTTEQANAPQVHEA